MNNFESFMLKYFWQIDPQDEREMQIVTSITARPVVYIVIALLIGGGISSIYDAVHHQYSAGTYILWGMAIIIALYFDLQFRKHDFHKFRVYSKQEEQLLKRKMAIWSLITSLLYTLFFILIQVYLPLLITGKPFVTLQDMYGIYIIFFAVSWLFSYGRKADLIKYEK